MSDPYENIAGRHRHGKANNMDITPLTSQDWRSIAKCVGEFVAIWVVIALVWVARVGW